MKQRRDIEVIFFIFLVSLGSSVYTMEQSQKGGRPEVKELTGVRFADGEGSRRQSFCNELYQLDELQDGSPSGGSPLVGDSPFAVGLDLNQSSVIIQQSRGFGYPVQSDPTKISRQGLEGSSPDGKSSELSAKLEKIRLQRAAWITRTRGGSASSRSGRSSLGSVDDEWDFKPIVMENAKKFVKDIIEADQHVLGYAFRYLNALKIYEEACICNNMVGVAVLKSALELVEKQKFDSEQEKTLLKHYVASIAMEVRNGRFSPEFLKHLKIGLEEYIKLKKDSKDLVVQESLPAQVGK